MPKVTRRQALSAGTIACAPAIQVRGAQRSGRPKNILFLLSDQHKPDVLGIDSHPVARTPNLDAVAREGVRFSNAYCTNPVCTPSRASLLTGLYTHNHKTWNNGTPWPFEHQTMAHYFSRAGYMTALVGKMHFVDAQTHGFDYRLDFNDWFQYLGPKSKLYAEELSRRNSGSGNPQIDDLWRDYDDPWNGVRELDNREGPVHVGRASKLVERDHFESFVTRESIRFLKNHGKRQPFLLISSFLKPHDPFMPAQRFADMYKPADMKLPDTWGKADLNTVPQEIKDTILNNRPTPELKDEQAAKLRIAMYHANVTQMDDCCGQILRALKDQGLEDDTIVLYSSDHGEMLGEHGLWQKFVFYESSVGVPLIFRVPGMTPRGARCNTPVSLAQLVATFCELCDVPVPSNLDGEGFVNSLREPSRKLDKTVFAEFNLQTPRAKYMIRRGDFKYNFYANDIAELFNLRTDPKEMTNLAMKPDHRSKVDELKSQLFAWYKPPEIGMRSQA